MMKSISFTLFFFAAFASLAQKGKFDLVIKNANVFDSRTGRLAPNRTILIKGGVITNVTNNRKNYSSDKTINAGGKLVTPGFVDTHIHPTDIYRSFGALPEYFSNDSLEIYRKRLSDTYLPYGVTVAMIMGQSEKWLQPILNWHNNPQAYYVDIYTAGGALVSNEGRKPYINHVIVDSPLAAKQKVLDYYGLGIRHIKLYWKLRRTEFETAFRTADSLGMNVYGHVDQNIMFMDTALTIGLRNYEHLLTLVNSVLHMQNDGKEFTAAMQKQYAPGAAKNGQLERLEMFRFIHDKRPEAIDSLIDKLSASKTTFSTSIHLMAEPFGLTYFTTKMDTSLSAGQLIRCRENFKLFMRYVKKVFDKGIKLRIGTDWPIGGKAIISEQLLLAAYGFSIPDILQISTINGASALGLGDKYVRLKQERKPIYLFGTKVRLMMLKIFLPERQSLKMELFSTMETAVIKRLKTAHNICMPKEQLEEK